MSRAKITVIGGGFVGSTCAHWLLVKNCGDVFLMDLREDLIQGRALDLMQSTPLVSGSSQVHAISNYRDIQNSDVIVITAGSPRKPGMSRDDLRQVNSQVITQICLEIKKHAPQSVVMIVTNPVDIMAYHALKTLQFLPQRVIGMAGVLDSLRFRYFVAQELGVSVKDVHAFVLGGHGDTMLAFPRLCLVGGIPLGELMSLDRIQFLVERTKKGGAEIVSFLKTGSAYYAPALSVVEMVEAVLRDERRVFPCSVYLNGQYGVKDLFMGVLCCLGKGGVQKIMEFSLTASEKKQFQQSVQEVSSQVAKLQ